MLTSRSKAKLDLARSLGADLAVSPADDLDAAAERLTSGEGFDVTIEAAGTWEALHDAIRLTAPRGRVAVVGCASAEPYGYSLERLIGVEVSLLGVRGSPGVWPQTIDMMARGDLRVAPLVSHKFPLEQFRTAFSMAEAGGPDLMKVLLKP